MVSGQSGDPLGASEARAMAFRWLTRREHSCSELVAKLERRGINRDTAVATVCQLASEGSVSDARFAEGMARSRVSRLFGPLKIRAVLRQRGVEDTLIDAALDAYGDSQWDDFALQWIRKRATRSMSRSEKARLYRSGKNRGFTHAQMMRALDRMADAP